MNKKTSRLRRARKTRAHIKLLRANRLCVFKTPRHIYAQIIAPEGDKVLVSASTLDKGCRGDISYSGNKDAAAVIGKILAERAKEVGIEAVAFDRSGFKYHGRIKALADAAREHGLQF
jgi:large subunit ribosomal protein L18